MEGLIDDQQFRGIIPRLTNELFEVIANADPHLEFMIKVSMCEIYLEKIRDLFDRMHACRKREWKNRESAETPFAGAEIPFLFICPCFALSLACLSLLTATKSNLAIREDVVRGVFVQDATEIYVSTEEEVLDVMKRGSRDRAVSATGLLLFCFVLIQSVLSWLFGSPTVVSGMNAGSSRSHSIFILHLTQKDLNTLSMKTSKLFLVDLAGSEKVCFLFLSERESCERHA